MAKLRKQVSLDFLDYTKSTINELLCCEMPQHAKYKLCIIMEKLLEQTKSSNGYNYLYWSKYGCNDWQEVKQKIKGSVENFTIPDEFMYGPDYKDGDMDFVSEIQGKWSRRYR
jgi:agmatine/peptidylarginine deiminase